MSDFQDATFIPPTPPKRAILDYSATLDGAAVSTLEAQALALNGLKAKIVVLPENFEVDNLKEFARQLAATWEVAGNRMLLVVDLKSHKVQMVAGKQLADSGLTSDVINQQIIAQHFVPYMRNDDLAGAISHTLVAANAVVSSGANTAPMVPGQPARTGATSAGSFQIPQNEQTKTSSEQPAALPSPSQENFFSSVSGIFITLGVVAAIGAVLYFASEVKQKKENGKLADVFNKAVGPLYEKADQIGAASEYLSTQDQRDLAQRIATFFNRLTTFEQAVREVQGLVSANHIWKVRDGYLKLIQMIGLLAPEAETLKNDLNAATGGIETFKSADNEPNLTEQVQQAQLPQSQYIRMPGTVTSANFRRPSWSYSPSFYNVIGAGTGLASMLILMDQMQGFASDSRFDNNSQPDYSADINSQGSLWGSYDNNGVNSSGSVDGGGSWDDSSRGGSDSGSGGDSTSGGSDGGGSW